MLTVEQRPEGSLSVMTGEREGGGVKHVWSYTLFCG